MEFQKNFLGEDFIINSIYPKAKKLELNSPLNFIKLYLKLKKKKEEEISHYLLELSSDCMSTIIQDLDQ